MDWDKLRTFNAAVETGSFSSAGLMLNLSQSAVSRQISSLEHDLKTALFHRHARGLKLTEQGEVLHEAAREVIACVSIAEARLTENREHPERGAEDQHRRGVRRILACTAAKGIPRTLS
ncbi:MAG: LysR family transcriptional regulator [Aliidongia sp.]